MAKFTPQEYKQQRRAGDAGGALGLVGGTTAGYYTAKTGRRAQSAAQGSKVAYRGMRQLGSTRRSSAGAALRTLKAGFNTKTRGPGIGTAATMYTGAVTGAVAGAAIADGHVKRKQMARKVEKSATISAFGVDHA